MAKKGKSKSRGWRYGEFVVGLAVGVVLALWVYPMLARWWTEPLPEVLANNPSSSPIFEFYDILERGEEIVEEVLSPADPTPPQPADESGTQQAEDTAPAAQPSADTATVAQESGAGAAPAATAASGASEPQSAAPAPVATPGVYLLQLGAFSRELEAEALKARLALVGIDASIQPVRRNQQVIYRVRTNPTSDLERLNTIRDRLQEHRFQYYRIRLPN